MGGMLVLEYAYFGPEYVRAIVPIATSSRHSAWGISWGEAQRQSICSDPKYNNGHYDLEDPPTAGLGAARMSALLTYRSRNSFESRFGRNAADPSRRQGTNGGSQNSTAQSNENRAAHTDGHGSTGGSHTALKSVGNSTSTTTSQPSTSAINGSSTSVTDPQSNGATVSSSQSSQSTIDTREPTTTYFSAQSYLRYQGEKFVKRFDSNCYIAITRKLDTHDVSRGRVPENSPDEIALALSQIQQPALVLGIESDGLFTFAEQQEIADGIPDSRLRRIESPEGHDAFLLQFEQVNHHILEFFHEILPDIMKGPGVDTEDLDDNTIQTSVSEEKSSTFGEVEAAGDLTAW